MLRFLPLLMLFMTIAGCGFSPMHGTDRDGQPRPAAALADIAIEPGADDLSQELGDRLARSIASGGAAGGGYALRLDASENIAGFAFRDDRAVTRERVQIKVDMTLVEAATGRVLLTEEMSGGSSYDIVQSDFANVATRRDARERAADQLADRVAARLARYFSRTDGD